MQKQGFLTKVRMHLRNKIAVCGAKKEASVYKEAIIFEDVFLFPQ